MSELKPRDWIPTGEQLNYYEKHGEYPPDPCRPNSIADIEKAVVKRLDESWESIVDVGYRTIARDSMELRQEDLIDILNQAKDGKLERVEE